jgi:tRNA pseudouridine38-40 synthase
MRFAIGIEYDGSPYFGWQTQRQSPTVQATLETALSKVANHDVRLICCGRTDTGVHALGQVAHFDSSAVRSERSWVLGINSHLPATASVLWIRKVDDDFHARFSAYSRSYRYIIMNRWIRPALYNGKVCWCRKPLDEEAMNEAAQALMGEHDFTSYRAQACQARHATREIQSILVTRKNNLVQLDVTANGFLYHMVRNIAGNLMSVGKGDQPASWVGELLTLKDRTKGEATAPAVGLYFVGARFPERYGLPESPPDYPRGMDQS